jgi:hypothetical protein
MIHLKRRLLQSKKKKRVFPVVFKTATLFFVLNFVSLLTLYSHILVPPQGNSINNVAKVYMNKKKILLQHWSLKFPFALIKPFPLSSGQLECKNDMFILRDLKSSINPDGKLILKGIANCDLSEINLILKLENTNVNQIIRTTLPFTAFITRSRFHLTGKKSELNIEGWATVKSTFINDALNVSAHFYSEIQKISFYITSTSSHIFIKGVYSNQYGFENLESSVPLLLKNKNTNITKKEDAFNKIPDSSLQNKNTNSASPLSHSSLSIFSSKIENNIYNENDSEEDKNIFDFQNYKKNLLKDIYQDIYKTDQLLNSIK